MKGNEALAEAAIRAGCQVFCGYPITPSSEILEYMSWRLPEVGGHFIQAESEVSAISMIYGAASAGFRALTASSGPGVSLKQEGISYIAAAELPAVIVDVQRYGSGLGLISPGQGDYFQATKGGGHGDYRLLVLAPASIQEMVDLVGLAFDKAEEYRNPAMILSDGALGQMMEPVELPPMTEHNPDKPWALRGKGKGKPKVIHTPVYWDPDNYDRNLRTKYATIAEKEQRYEAVMLDDADIVLIAYGISARACKQAVSMGQKKGVKVGLLRPITLWPFPARAVAAAAQSAKAFLSVEMSGLGQMVEDVRLAVNGKTPVYSLPCGKDAPTANGILKMVEGISDGSIKEVL